LTQRRIHDVERRNFVLFLVLSFLVLTANQILMAPRGGEQPAPKPEQKAEQKPEQKPEQQAEPAAADARPAAEDAAPAENAASEPPAEEAGNPPEAAPAPESENAQEFITLGSADVSTGYRMLVTLTNTGAAVQRIELASPRYLDLDNYSGYLGNLEVAADGGAGLAVRAVGDGTPAARAGLRAGDRLLEAGRGGTTPLASPEDWNRVLAGSKPRQTLSLVIERDGQRQTLSVELVRRPLEIIRPEAENVLLRSGRLPADFEAPTSFLLDLEQIDGQKVSNGGESLADVDLYDANWRIVESPQGDADSSSVTFERRLTKWGLVVRKRYQLDKAPPEAALDPDAPAYDLTLEVTIANEANDAAHTVAYRLDGPNGLPIEGWWYATKIGRSWGAAGLRDVVGRYFGGEVQQQGAATIASGEAEDFEGDALAYMGVDAQYFLVALLPQIQSSEEGWIPRTHSMVAGTEPDLKKGEGKFANVTSRLFSEPLELKAGQTVTHRYTVFAGPKRPQLLGTYQAADVPAYSLSDAVYYGWFGAVARAMVGLLHLFYGFVGNYGAAIIMLTVLVRGLMFPISRGQAKSMAKLQELRPEMDRIKEMYKGDQQKQAQAMQQLYRKHKVNPLAGCLPMVIQLPVFIGLYRGLAVDVELRGSPLFGEAIRWCSNLAAPDMLYDWSSWMPTLVTRNLGPYLNVLPLVTIVLFLVQQKMFMPEPANEQAALQQKIMKYMMVFMGLLFYKVPSGLCLYFIASSLWGIAERKLIPPPTAPAGAAGATPSPSPGKSRAAGSTAPDRRAAKNGATRGKGGAKSKRRR
jgi:YidC/Oxa1 family membrane protein insertase